MLDSIYHIALQLLLIKLSMTPKFSNKGSSMTPKHFRFAETLKKIDQPHRKKTLF